MINNQLIYVTDPLCLWCYGIAPELDAFFASLPDDLEGITINGGLFPGAQAKVADKNFQDYLKNAAEHVTEKTGQIFSNSFWELLASDNFLYDTEPAARASVVVKELAGDTKMRSFIHKLQKSVFVDGNNPNLEDTLSELAYSCGVDKVEFVEKYRSDSNLEMTRGEYALAKTMNVRGFPALIYIGEKKGFQIGAGYATLGELTQAFDYARGQCGQPMLNDSASVCGTTGCQ
jgi:putative protein-disulfide isomerase